jgi:UDP-glucuronate 4-epimerase
LYNGRWQDILRGVNKRVLVTGAAGFIGFHAASALHARGDQVLGIDNFNEYYPSALKRARAEQLARLGVSVVQMDLNDPRLEAMAVEFQPTHVLHLAAQAGVRYSLEAPDAYLHSNINGFLRMLELVRHQGWPMIYASSSSVYGERDAGPFQVQDVTDQPTSLYAATKKANELMAYSYHKLYGLRLTGLRYFTVYGPWGRPDMAYYSFAEAILDHRPIALFHNGKAERDFTYVDDVVQGTLAALDLSADWALFNIGNSSPQPVSKLVDCLERSLGKKAVRQLQPAQKGDVSRTWAEIGESRKRLGYNPQTSLEEGISRFVEWLTAYRGSASK